MPDTTLSRIRTGARKGALLALALLGIGSVRFIIALAMGKLGLAAIHPEDVLPVAGLIVVYCGALTSAGAVLGLLWPLSRSAGGTFLLGYLGAAIVSAILTLLILQLEHSHSLRTYAFVVAIMTVWFGTLVGYLLNRRLR